MDGTPIFTTAADAQSEEAVAISIATRWGCELHRFGMLSPIDWYSTRHGRLTGVLELKSRSHERATYPTVFLNVRKWLTLSLAQTGLGVPAVFVVRFVDGIYWCRVSDVDASRHRMGGCARRVKADSDVEPVIEVPVSALKRL